MRSWYWRATTSGSGRRKTSITSAATAKPAMLTRNAPARSGTPRSGPTTGAVHQSGERPARQRGSEPADGDGHARPGIRARDAGGHDAADGQGDRLPGAPADLGHEERGHQLLADRGTTGRRCQGGHGAGDATEGDRITAAGFW